VSPTPDQLRARRERAAAAVAEDERLRGDLTDDVFAPLQRWALAWVDAYAAATAGLDDEAAASQAIDRGLQWTKAQLGALVGALAGWESTDPASRRSRLAALAPSFPAPRLAGDLGALAAIADARRAARQVAVRLPRPPRAPG
jgi:hypothetical protein